ncbi:hypothetical protein DDE05_05155, partial [Streptomyces cavourensis]
MNHSDAEIVFDMPTGGGFDSGKADTAARTPRRNRSATGPTRATITPGRPHDDRRSQDHRRE